jgi:hypothetical protein
LVGRSNDDEADGFHHRHSRRINRHHQHQAAANVSMSTGSPTFIANANRVISNELDNTLQSIPLQLHHQAVHERRLKWLYFG